MEIKFTKQLKSLIDEQGNITNFAKKVGLSRQTIGFYLDGTRMPDMTSLVKISEATHRSLDWLVYDRVDDYMMLKAVHDICDSIGDLTFKLSECEEVLDKATFEFEDKMINMGIVDTTQFEKE